MEVPPTVIESVRGMQRPVVVSHVRPDADCLGSMLGLASVLKATGAAARVSVPAGTVSRRLAFMVAWGEVDAASDDDFAKADGFIAVDTAKKSRCNVPKSLGDDWSAGRPLVNIDHHESNTNFGDVNWVEASAASSSELVYRLIRAAEWPMSANVASLLYSGVHSDTVGFSLPTATADSLGIAADLVRHGADVGTVGQRLYRSQAASEFGLARLIYANTRIVAGGAIAYSTATFDELTCTGCTAADVDDQVGIPRSIDGIRMAILFTEGKPGKTRVNLRGEDGVNVLSLATELGGGGHAQSAGAVIDAAVPEAVERVLNRAIEHLR